MKWMGRLHELGGAATTLQLRNAGATRETLAEAVNAGVVVRPRRGVYALATLAGPPRAAVAAGARLSCVTACRSYGIWAGTDPRVHVVIPPNGRRRPDGFVCHWRAAEPGEQVWRVSLADCLRTVGHCADEETAVAAFDTALSAGLLSSFELADIMRSAPRAVRARAARARTGSESGVESLVRQRLEARGHHVQQQVHVSGVGRVDMLVDGELYLEVDGYAFHGDAGAFERDRRRDTRLAADGHRRLRVSARSVLTEWPVVAHSIERVLRPLHPQRTHSNGGTNPALPAVLLTDGAAASARRTQEET
ncbi:type IV toxin-antitoxin system AbiEi family antitoxin domain-containing protein [Leifsonia sp. TF02-11]|uniref:type IV toxin-antitoxin system AbiEi family antitoxin domain-containing protein n=1 Tax=Leifsonia sp. TF02-11 TaxID=2815212 RepID=UPI001AA0D951|nr:type IV toxin-antitoxin system AbiEi family antitoxin domain-containing protein [Leifsonia sp. TF02-11]MBO1741703.1 type IV toxin-antitoxin system AbiEi family antitoxin domain-containing protein [Leifsonia sp. TF02-11]